MSTPTSMHPLTYGTAVPRKLTPEGRPLTGRERQLLILAGHGFTETEIAERLGVSRSTVTNRTWHVMNKLGAANKSHAIVLCFLSGVLTRADFEDAPAGANGAPHTEDASAK